MAARMFFENVVPPYSDSFVYLVLFTINKIHFYNNDLPLN